MGGPGSGRRKGSGGGISKSDMKQIRMNKKLDNQYRKELKKKGINPATGNPIRKRGKK
jgi:hypothetical protein